MARRRKAQKREVKLDPRHQSELVAHLTSMVMRRGKRSTAERIVYQALDLLGEKTGENPLEVFERALDNVKPRLEVKSRRVGGATYQVPLEVSGKRQMTLAMRWVVQYSKTRKGSTMDRALGLELLDAFQNQGASIKKRDDVHKMAQANKAFAHYRW